MTSAQLPRLSFGTSDFRISFFATSTDDIAKSLLDPSTTSRDAAELDGHGLRSSADPILLEMKSQVAVVDLQPSVDASPELDMLLPTESTQASELDRASVAESRDGSQAGVGARAGSEAAETEHNPARGPEPCAPHSHATEPAVKGGGTTEKEPGDAQEHEAGSVSEPSKDTELQIEIEAESESEAGLEPGLESEPDLADAVPKADQTSGPTILTHPVPSMQDAFTESLEEVTNGGPSRKPKLRELSAERRREWLLDQGQDEAPFDALWRYRPGQKQHEVFKLISQISFGVYLLLNGMANNTSQVISILQAHIDEVDEFLEVSLEDQYAASTDLQERRGHLRLPLANMRTFERLLEDRGYRAEILAGNEKIEHVLARTNAMLAQWDDDIDKGLTSSLTFQAWLRSLKQGASFRPTQDLMQVFEAMQGNAEGWLNAFDEMNRRSAAIKKSVAELNNIMVEIEDKVGEMSRRALAIVQPFSSPSSSTRSTAAATSSRSPPSLFALPHPRSHASVRTASLTSPPSRSYEDSQEDFPIPGVAPILPLTRSPARDRANATPDSTRLKLETTGLKSRAPAVAEATMAEVRDESEDGGLYILQPRTYTPLPPEPLPSPMLKDSPVIICHRDSQGMPRRNEHDSFSPQGRTSVRERVSLRTELPEDIRIPHGSFEAQSHHRRQLSNRATPRTFDSRARDSAIGSDFGTPHQRQRSRVYSSADLSPTFARPSLPPSPRSEYQKPHAARASPQSVPPRPHTAGPGAHRPGGFSPQHQRNQPSRLGGMSTLSQVTMATNLDAPAHSTSPAMQAGEKKLKKKKSAFGWLRKAFSLDEEEKAAFKARKYVIPGEEYYGGSAPQFLDGRRVK